MPVGADFHLSIIAPGLRAGAGKMIGAGISSLLAAHHSLALDQAVVVQAKQIELTRAARPLSPQLGRSVDEARMAAFGPRCFALLIWLSPLSAAIIPLVVHVLVGIALLA